MERFPGGFTRMSLMSVEVTAVYFSSLEGPPNSA